MIFIAIYLGIGFVCYVYSMFLMGFDRMKGYSVLRSIWFMLLSMVIFTIGWPRAIGTILEDIGRRLR